MRFSECFIVFPEGDVQEIDGRLGIGTLVDVNGRPLAIPLPNHKTLAYRVDRVASREERNGTETYHYLSLMSADELGPYAR